MITANDNGAARLSWVHGNHMGVPAVYTDASGGEIAFPTSYSAPGFPGQSRTFADLYYNRYRDYDPTTGRYIQADPIGLAGGPSPYSYAMNNPLRYTDPTGLFVDTVLDVGFVFYGIYRIGADNIFGENCPGSLEENATALGLDVAAIFIPGATGLGAASRVARNGPKIGGGANLKHLSPSEQKRIQNAADKSGADITVVGSQTTGRKPYSDFDFILEGSNARRKNRIHDSLPRGPRGTGDGSGRDFLDGPVDKSRPFIKFKPKPKG